MTFRKHRPDRPTRKAVRAAFAAQAPLDSTAAVPQREGRRGKVEDDNAPIEIGDEADGRGDD